jgi:dTDP-4-amino-4,6-dideoxygalactose transaminase
MHRSPVYQSARSGAIEVADRIHRDALSLPCSVGLGERDLERVVGIIAAEARAQRP